MWRLKNRSRCHFRTFLPYHSQLQALEEAGLIRMRKAGPQSIRVFPHDRSWFFARWPWRLVHNMEARLPWEAGFPRGGAQSSWGFIFHAFIHEFQQFDQKLFIHNSNKIYGYTLFIDCYVASSLFIHNCHMTWRPREPLIGSKWSWWDTYGVYGVTGSMVLQGIMSACLWV